MPGVTDVGRFVRDYFFFLTAAGLIGLAILKPDTGIAIVNTIGGILKGGYNAAAGK